MGIRKMRLAAMTAVIMSIGAIPITIALIAYPPHACFWNRNPLLNTPPTMHRHKDDTISYVGVIDCENSLQFNEYLEKNGAGVRFASINSPGGVKRGADWMVDILDNRKKTVIIEDGAACGSACVFVFLRSPGAVAQPGALFFFHKGHSDDPKYEGVLTEMRDWAREMSPHLVDFLTSCTVDPTTTDEGIFLYWHEITEITEGRFFDCNFMVTLNKVRGKEFDSRLR